MTRLVPAPVLASLGLCVLQPEGSRVSHSVFLSPPHQLGIETGRWWRWPSRSLAAYGSVCDYKPTLRLPYPCLGEAEEISRLSASFCSWRRSW